MAATLATIDIAWEDVEALREEAGQVLSPARLDILERLVHGFARLQELVAEQGMTIGKLRRLCRIWRSSEKTSDVLGDGATGDGCPTGNPLTATGDPASSASAQTDASTATAAAPDSTHSTGSDSRATASTAADTPDLTNSTDGDSGDGTAKPSGAEKPKRKAKANLGHGRLAFSDYPAAECIPVLHATLKAGDKCPLCGKGTLYDIDRPAPVVRIVGQPPLAGTIWLCQNLRCTTCGHLFTASPPAQASGPKYDPTADAMLLMTRYGLGLPHHRMAGLQDNLGIPMPPSTAWDRVHRATEELRPVYDELRRQAAQGQLLHGDDSYVRILAFMGRRRAKLVQDGQLEDPDRTGLFTSAIVAVTGDNHTIALYASGRRHLGENLDELLDLRHKDLDPPLTMSDALDRNVPKRHPVAESNCIQHGRRKIVEQVDNFPAECAYLLLRIRRVYRIDHLCRRHHLTPAQRLRVHQRFSQPVMDEIHVWMIAQLEEKRVEPNSGLGKALRYFLKRWDKLTVFLRRAGAALDNNIAERALKMAIQHRRNSLSFLSQKGATAGDIAMTLIHTARLEHVNVFDYLTELLRHAKELAKDPAAFLPWTYRDTIDRQTSADRPADPPTVTAPPGHDPVIGLARPATTRPVHPPGSAPPASTCPAMSSVSAGLSPGASSPPPF